MSDIKHNIRVLFFLLSSTSLFFAIGCEDLLPPYLPPSNIFSSRTDIDTFIVQYYETEVWFPELHGPLIDYGRYSNPYSFYYSIINNYEETIEANSDLTGKIEIWQDGNPGRKRTLIISQSNLYSYEIYNSTTKTVRIDPGKALVVRARWNYLMDDSTWVHKKMAVAGETDIPNYILRYFTPALFHVRSSVAINKKMPAIISDTTFVLTLVGRIKLAPP